MVSFFVAVYLFGAAVTWVVLNAQPADKQPNGTAEWAWNLALWPLALYGRLRG